MARREERRFWISYGRRLGLNVLELRKMRGLTQERLAELAGLTRNVVSNIERNENNSKSTDPVLSTVYMLARALHVPPAVLLPGGDEYVDDICTAGEPHIDLVWPAQPEDTMPFDVQHLHEMRQGRPPRLELHRPLEATDGDGPSVPPGAGSD
ncbi:helix-turn-helix domain-containing protein [Corynebacterium halotolerans]|uniref:helix-turn-helix domain-containing protein n=1 Tax=Corynebacterium halotolerans TaxID=225326 RepID=UPI003CF134CA